MGLKQLYSDNFSNVKFVCFPILAAFVVAANLLLIVGIAGAATPVLVNPRFVLADFGYNSGWRLQRHPRFVTDITNDGRADIVGFGEAGVWTAVSVGNGNFAPPRFVLADFGAQSGWLVARHFRGIADINGDGRADIVGVGDAGVYVALGLGDGSFAPVRFVLAAFGASTRTLNDFFQALLADVNGDRRADLIVVVGEPRQVHVMLASSVGTFAAPVLASTEFTFLSHLAITDVTGDARADLVASRDPTRDPLLVAPALADGSGRFAAARASGPGSFTEIADVTGDGKPELIQFGAISGADPRADHNTYFALNTGSGRFDPFRLAVADLAPGLNRLNARDILVADVTGDARAELIGFGDAGVYVSRWLGGSQFSAPQLVIANFCFNRGWSFEHHPRFVADITGDHVGDIIGFGNAGVYVAIADSNSGGTFK